ncbi:MAG: sensor histidine kinase [Parasporobacterium sp.]|nr:sensor histidine kinase [Parasporobacterium sp.]
MWLYIAIALAVTNIVTLAVVLHNDRKRKLQMELFIKDRIKLENQMEMDKKNAEITSLQSQINPHFLYNTLEVIRSEAIINQDYAAAEMSEALANYFRYNISRKSDTVTVGDELDNVGNYISIQKGRFGERVSYEIRYDSDEAEIRKAMIPKLTLQPLVENAIFHGLEKKAGNGKVTVHAVCTGVRIILRVTDDGPGMNEQTLKEVERKINGVTMADDRPNTDKHGGIALANINKRIKMVFGEEFGLYITSTPGIGTEAEVIMPYRKKE